MFRKANHWIPVGILTASCLFWSAGLAALTINVVLSSNSASLSGANAILAFDFISPLDSLSNTGTLSPLSSNGTLGAATIFGDVTDTGGLGIGPWTFSDAGDTSFFNELLVDFQFNVLPTGTLLSFSFTPLTDNPPLGLLPDSFAFFVLDSSGINTLIKTSDPSDALFLFNFGQGEQALNVFVPLDSGISLEVTSSQGGAPEPGTLALLVAGFAALLRRRRFV